MQNALAQDFAMLVGVINRTTTRVQDQEKLSAQL